MENSFRPNVSALILSEEYPTKELFFIAKRNDLKNIWQFPQGGIESSESIEEALHREMEEEIGIKNFDVISLYDEWLYYKFSKPIVRDNITYIGQKQKFFLIKLKDNGEINLDSITPEFDDYKFVDYDGLRKEISPFKRDTYYKVLDYFLNEENIHC